MNLPGTHLSCFCFSLFHGISLVAEEQPLFASFVKTSISFQVNSFGISEVDFALSRDCRSSFPVSGILMRRISSLPKGFCQGKHILHDDFDSFCTWLRTRYLFEDV